MLDGDVKLTMEVICCKEDVPQLRKELWNWWNGNNCGMGEIKIRTRKILRIDKDGKVIE